MSYRKKNYSNKKHIVIIVIWLVVIGISFSARDAITDDVESATDIIGSDSESSMGSDIFRERFNVTSDDIVHILIIQIPDGESFLSNQWRNYTLFLTQYLNESLFELGYEQYYSEAVLHLAGLDEFGAAFVSDSETIALINIVASGNSFGNGDDVLLDDVHQIRSLVAPENVTKGVYDLAETALASLPDGLFDLFMPLEETAEDAEYLLTGNGANFADILESSQESFEQSEFLAIMVAIIILALVFKSPLGVFIPIFAMAASLFPTYLLTTLLGKAGLFAISDFLPAIIGMIGIAVAVDYNLFSLVRFREEFRKRKAKLMNEDNWNRETKRTAKHEAAAYTNKTTGQAVMYSGFTVIIGFSSMLMLGSDFTLGMAVSVSIVVAVSILTARSLTPSILSIFGHVLDWPNFISGGNRAVDRLRGRRKMNGNFWQKWSRFVLKKPITFLFIGLLTMVPFVVTAAQTELSFDFVKTLPVGTESRDGFEILIEDFDFGSLNPIDLILDLGENTDFFADDYKEKAAGIMDRIDEFAAWVMGFEEIRDRDKVVMKFDTVSSFPLVPNGDGFDYYNYTQLLTILNLPAMLPAIDPSTGQYIINPETSQPFMINNTMTPQFIGYISDFINWDYGNNTIRITLTTPVDPGSPAGWELIDDIREKVSELFDYEDVEGAYVTGMSAMFKDSKDEMYVNVPQMLLLAVVLIFLALLVLFRSIVLPIKAILTISGSILFALGSLVMVFEYGWFNDVTIAGYQIWSAEVVGITYFLPVFLFTTILGLGMDYSILIISRIKEEYDKTGDMDEAVGTGLAKTAGVITSAATVMVATFLVFAGAPMLILKMMGMAMAIAIVVDATISRIILLPAAMKLLGKQNWWLPKWLDKILPRLDLEH